MKDLIKFLNSNTFCRIGRSKIDGVGVLAIRDIPKGVNPFVGSLSRTYRGLEFKELKKLKPEVRKMVLDFCNLSQGKAWIPRGGLNSFDISSFMNHSNNPNVGYPNNGEEMATLRKIRKGEELTIDYGTFDENLANWAK
jgi:hypothetical protein